MATTWVCYGLFMPLSNEQFSFSRVKQIIISVVTCLLSHRVGIILLYVHCTWWFSFLQILLIWFITHDIIS